MVDTAGVARDQLLELVSQTQRVGPSLPPAAAAELAAACARAGHAARALLSVAQVDHMIVRVKMIVICNDDNTLCSILTLLD